MSQHAKATTRVGRPSAADSGRPPATTVGRQRMTDYRDAYGNRMLTGRTPAVTIDQSTPAVPVEGRVTEGSRWRKKHQGMEKHWEERGGHQETRPSDYYGNRWRN